MTRLGALRARRRGGARRGGLRRKRRAADRGRARHARLVRDLAGGEEGVRGRERPRSCKILKAGDAGEVVTRALLTAGNPEGDVLFGVDNNLLAARARRRRLRAVRVAGAREVDPELVLDPEHRATPIDRGDVCLNYDKAWFASHGLAPPPNARRPHAAALPRAARRREPRDVDARASRSCSRRSRSSASGWQGYWRKLRANDVLVVDGWEDAYYARFSGAAGSKGKRPDRRLVRVEPARRGDLPRSRGRADGADRRRRGRAASGRSSSPACCAGARNEDGRAQARRLHALEALPGGHPAADVRVPGAARAALPPEFERFAVVPDAPARAPARGDRGEPRALGGRVDGHRGSVSGRAWRAAHATAFRSRSSRCSSSIRSPPSSSAACAGRAIRRSTSSPIR